MSDEEKNLIATDLMCEYMNGRYYLIYDDKVLYYSVEADGMHKIMAYDEKTGMIKEIYSEPYKDSAAEDLVTPNYLYLLGKYSDYLVFMDQSYEQNLQEESGFLVILNLKDKEEIRVRSSYYMEGYPMMGKTGTAQIYDEKTGTYMKGASDYIYSFAGIYPADNPEIIVYTGLKKPKDTTNYVATSVKDIVINTSKYLNIVTDNSKTSVHTLKNYVNQSTAMAKGELESQMRLYILGTGEKVIAQYPKSATKLHSGSVVALVTDTYDKSMPNLVGLSYKDALNVLKLMGVKYNLSGNGYVTSQSIPEGIIVGNDVTVDLTLSNNLLE